ncbi:hypothetical protein [Sorangium sp. So ce233]|uniref:hypothetical protein n=1 Tax=Sorangium sp. So ce233 TaxID=3133290 RepID=UPI003F6007D7
MLDVRLAPQRDGRMTAAEQAARDLLEGELAEGTPEMAATLVERLAALVPVACLDCGEETDAAGLVRALREGAELS